MPQPDADAVAALKDAKPAFEKAWEQWDQRRDDTPAVEFYRDARDTWVDVVLRDGPGLGRSYVTAAAGIEVRSPNQRGHRRADSALVHRGTRPARWSSS